jgi:hypothetical protein
VGGGPCEFNKLGLIFKFSSMLRPRQGKSNVCRHTILSLSYYHENENKTKENEEKKERGIFTTSFQELQSLKTL